MKCPKCNASLELVAKDPSSSVRRASSASLPDTLGNILETINPANLSAFESEFMHKLRNRFAQYGEETYLSEKQVKILTEIANKGF